jgi:hypothetical protein
MYKYVFTLLIASSLSFAQSYFPLEVGNRWDYKESSWGNEVDTISVNVVADTLMPNGQRYFVLDRAMGPGRFLHVDSNFIYYYDESDSTDTPIYDLNAPLEEWYSIGMYANPLDSPRVQLAHIDTAIIFGVATRILFFDLDWLVPFTLGLSEKFGPIYHYTAHHTPYWTSIIGCKIFDSTFGTLVSVEDQNELISNFHLSQNYPNPFNPTTKIEYSIPTDNNVEIKVFNVLGVEVATLLNEQRQAGTHSIEFKSDALPSGIYFYKINSGKYSEVKKMILLR